MFGKIYRILNKINGKSYIGQTTLNDVVKDRYGYNIEKSTHNEHLRNAIKKYGIENFTIKIIEYCETKEILDRQEMYWISYYDSYKNGYNETLGGHNGISTPEGIEKMKNSIQKFWANNPDKKLELSNKYSGENNPMHKKGGHTQESIDKMKQIRLEMMSNPNTNIDIDKARELSLTPEARKRRNISASKYWIVQYDSNMQELNRWHTLKDMYDYMINNGYDTFYKNYRSFKLPLSQNKIFCQNLYLCYGFYFDKIEKTDIEKMNIKKTN